jgi:hypothetical protein
MYIESFEREKDIVATINRKLYPCVARTSLNLLENYRVVQSPYLLNESPYILVIRGLALVTSSIVVTFTVLSVLV